jgi:proteic killer suppression protein
MIGSIKHKGLKRLYEDGDGRAISGNLRLKIQEILTVLENANSVEEADIPGCTLLQVI